ncbi:MAG: hypothetical protein HN353_03290 [Bdellovibrionales bacterium]|nr:hypothetical protein [Bdellovibrionales bacterium]MBT3526092.1 hypothetical protein [Bdellovibrionales bacterium]MBT7668216.1 hypothetical protein [Bdellovibrionales bacterium]
MSIVRNLLLCLILLLLGSSLVAFEVSTKLSIGRPLKGKPFYLSIVVKGVEGDAEPFISFDPGRIVVRGRKLDKSGQLYNRGSGKTVAVRDFRFKYEMVITSGGQHSIRNIRVEHQGKIHRVRSVILFVRTTPARPQNVFILTELSKTQAVVGEGVNLDYFLYYRQVKLGSVDIKKFPKLNNFIKRFHLPAGVIETVTYQGMIYKRQLKYSARIYPQKRGKLIIDPLQMRVESRRISGRQYLTGRPYAKNIMAPRVLLEVDPLPHSNVPIQFSGLVGQHQGTIMMPQRKFRIGDVVEFSLIITGEGNLERLAAPVIYNSKSLETFDTKTEFKETSLTQAKKQFNYTYLVRQPEKIAGRQLELAIFLPTKGKYEILRVKIPSIKLVGASGAAAGTANSAPPAAIKTDRKQSRTTKSNKQSGLMAPIFDYHEHFFSYNSLWRWVNWGLLLVVIGLLLLVVKSTKRVNSTAGDMEGMIQQAKAGEVSYSLIYQFVLQLADLARSPDNSVTEMVESTSLSDGTKQYFISTIESLEEMEFYGLEEQKIVLDNQHYQELISAVEHSVRDRDEDITQARR